MAGLENLDEEALRAKLEAATSYEERAAIRQALRTLKKERGEQVGGSKGARRGASYYNRFAGASRSGTVSKTPQSFVPTGAKSPSVTPLRSTTPTSRSQRSTTPTSHSQRLPTPTSPFGVGSPGPSAEEEEEMRKQQQRELEEQERQREEDRKERERQRRQREEEERAKERQLEEERQRQKDEEEQEMERQREELERQTEREEDDGGEQEDQIQKEEEEEEHERQGEEEGNDEGPKSPPSTPVEQENDKEWVVVDKERAKQLEKEAATALSDQTDGQAPSFGVQLRTAHVTKATSTQDTLGSRPKAEFQTFQLRKTQSGLAEKRNPVPSSSSASNFGINLKSWEVASRTSAPNVTAQRPRAQTYVTSAGHKKIPVTSPRRVATSTSASKVQAGGVGRTSSSQIQSGLVAYVNAALQLHPPLSPTSSSLYETCSNPSLLCKLINKSVRNTVDLRALTRTPPPSQAASREEALQENMTLVVESARAIGCRIDEDMGQRILNKDPETIRAFLQDLVRARVVHMPGMEDEPSSTFENFPLMLEKLGIWSGGSEETDQPSQVPASVAPREPSPGSGSGRGGEGTTVEPSSSKTSSAASVGPDKPSLDADLTYEERAARRRAERERRRKEREALATTK